MLTRIPTSAEFQASTNLKVLVSGKRNTDQALLRIDHLLDEYNAGDSTSTVAIACLGKLYFALDRWLQLADRQSPEVNARRRPAVYELYQFVVKRLCDEVRVTVNLLPFWLSNTFGRSMNAHGVKLDLEEHCANYISKEQLATFRLDFRGGVAFQQDFMHNSSTKVPANSENIRGVSGDRNRIQEAFSGYIVGLGGDFYSSPHFVGAENKGNGFYHSSYLGGQEVLCAGEIKIVRGVVEEINNESGHYRPDVKNVVMAVEMLAMHGVDLRRLMVSGFGITRANGVDFLRARGGFAVAVRPDAPGDTPLSRNQQKATLTQHGKAQEAARAFAQFKSHCSPVGRSRHSWQARHKCVECENFKDYYDMFVVAVSAQGGIDVVQVPVVRAALPSVPVAPLAPVA